MTQPNTFTTADEALQREEQMMGRACFLEYSAKHDGALFISYVTSPSTEFNLMERRGAVYFEGEPKWSGIFASWRADDE